MIALNITLVFSTLLNSEEKIEQQRNREKKDYLKNETIKIRQVLSINADCSMPELLNGVDSTLLNSTIVSGEQIVVFFLSRDDRRTFYLSNSC